MSEVLLLLFEEPQQESELCQILSESGIGVSGSNNEDRISIDAVAGEPVWLSLWRDELSGYRDELPVEWAPRDLWLLNYKNQPAAATVVASLASHRELVVDTDFGPIVDSADVLARVQRLGGWDWRTDMDTEET